MSAGPPKSHSSTIDHIGVPPVPDVGSVITAIRRARPSASRHTSAGVWLSLRYGPSGTPPPPGPHLAPPRPPKRPARRPQGSVPAPRPAGIAEEEARPVVADVQVGV